MDLETGLVLLTITSGLIWVIFAYLQFKLIKRILIVSKKQHDIPGNIFWIKRARLAIDTDDACHNLWRKRNISAMAFLLSLILVGGLMANTIFNGV